eukprot:CAMPEP_0177611814 /NCGR_PEP_ID=MMETSP0419_2-20121207/20772_1 /TAXON_ID=582737 /ORGANISM="Tetraselmis sp., Strain GSL018" /LENGTH=105 /DNA_ID=CAMNT_0019107729 /DNA_START=41 /DNA_END=359 /DNA_ORIENTATION=-
MARSERMQQLLQWTVCGEVPEPCAGPALPAPGCGEGAGEARALPELVQEFLESNGRLLEKLEGGSDLRRPSYDCCVPGLAVAAAYPLPASAGRGSLTPAILSADL